MPVGHDAIADDKAKSRAGADGLGGVKRLEQVRLDVGGNPGTVVHDFNNQLIVLKACCNADSAGAFDSVDGVVNKICPNLVEFAAIRHDARHGAVKRARQRHVFQLVAQHGQGALDAFVNVHLLHGRLIHERF